MVWAVFADDTGDCCPSDSPTISNLPEAPCAADFPTKSSMNSGDAPAMFGVKPLDAKTPCTGHYGSLQLPGLRH